MKAIDYFTSQITSYTEIALKLGWLISIVAIIWNCVQMVFGTLEQRKFLVGIITKYFFFMLCLAWFPAFSKGLGTFGTNLGQSVSGSSTEVLTKELSKLMENMKNKLDNIESSVMNSDRRYDMDYNGSTFKVNSEAFKYVTMGTSEYEQINKEIASIKDRLQNDEYQDSLRGNWKKKKDQENLYSIEYELQQLEKAKQDAIEKTSKGARRTYNAIQSVLRPVKNSNGETIEGKYVLDLSMKSNGKDTGYLSPNAMLRISLLCAQIMWEKEWQEDVMVDWAAKANKIKNFTDSDGEIDYAALNESNFKITKFPLKKIFSIILCFITMIMIVVVTIFCLIQYVMAIVEYAITSGMCIILIPCILFDGLKDMASKILPTLFAQAIKLSAITLCMFFCNHTYMDLALNVIPEMNGFSITLFAYIAFTMLLTFAICSNAPKLAVTLLTGQPQMSMGEFVQAAAAVAGGAVAAYKGAAAAKELGKKGVAKTAQFAANRVGDIGAGIGAVKGTLAAMKNNAISNGIDTNSRSYKAKEAIAGAKAFAGEGLRRTSRRMAGSASDLAHYNGKSGGFGSGGGNSESGTNRKNWNIDDPLKNGGVGGDIANMDFKNAKNVDDSGRYTTRQNLSEFYQTQRDSSMKNAYDRANAKYGNSNSNVRYAGSNLKTDFPKAIIDNSQSNKLPAPGLPDLSN